jgi:hypothetical protein
MVEVLSVGAGAADMVAMVHVFRWSAVYLYQRRQRHREFRLRGVWSSAPFHARVVVVILWHVYGSMVGVDLVLGSMFAGSGLARLLLGVVSVLMLIMRVGYRWVEVIVVLQLVLVGLAGSGVLVMIAIIVCLSFDGTLGGAVGERRRGDGGSVIAETSCCRIPDYPCPRIKPWESRTMMAVAVQGAPRYLKTFNQRLVIIA